MLGNTMRWGTGAAIAAVGVFVVAVVAHALEEPNRTATLWTPVVEWTIANPQFEGNPFDIAATAAFTHETTGETRTTGMFFDGGTTWRFRFFPTRTGRWTFQTTSTDADLDGHAGTVTVEPNPEPLARGCLATAENSRWAWQTGESGETRPFTPQLVMYKCLHAIESMPEEELRDDLRLWFDEHGFNGLHVRVMCRWFDFEKERHSDFDTDDPNPDPRTFAALERLITLTHQADGFVHIWKWGDEDRRMTPIRWGINGTADRRLQRYLAARLGPLPGWTLGYGFDLWEWVNAEQLHEWHAHMHEHLGWPRMLGGRAHQHGTPISRAMTYQLDYVGYETHRPDYDAYVAALEQQPDRPAFMEDRFRVRYSIWRAKDYSLDDTRRGLWRSTMAGGVANIWGYLLPDDDRGGSRPYPTRHQIRSYADFFANRFLNGMERDNTLTDGVCLRRGNAHFLFYGEDVHEISMNLSSMATAQPAIAIDTKTPYYEFEIGELEPGPHTWKAPYISDWAVAVGDF